MSVSKVSVILVNRNRCEDRNLRDDPGVCLKALKESDYAELQIIVVDNASTDCMAGAAGGLSEAVVCRNASDVGVAHATNQGLSYAEGDYICLIGTDTAVSCDFIRTLISFLESHPKAGAAGGKRFFWDEKNPLWSKDNDYFTHTELDAITGRTKVCTDELAEDREVSTLPQTAIVIRKTAISDVSVPFFYPLFSTEHVATDFFARVLWKGWRLYYVDSAEVWRRTDVSRPPYSNYHKEKDRLIFLYRHTGAKGRRHLLKENSRDAAVMTVRSIMPGAAKLSEEQVAIQGARNWFLRRFMTIDIPSETKRQEGLRHLLKGVHERTGYFSKKRPEVAALIPSSAREVVDAGCGNGSLGAMLKRTRPDIKVRGIEIAGDQAERARLVLDEVWTGSVEDGLPMGWPRPDCVVFADVLEHLPDPWTVLRHWSLTLKPNGTVVLSLPNVNHKTVLIQTIRGRWDYKDSGILDRKHLRFFTRKTIIEMLEQAKLHVIRMERVMELTPMVKKIRFATKKIRRYEQKGRFPSGPAELAALLNDYHTNQFLIVACRNE